MVPARSNLPAIAAVLDTIHLWLFVLSTGDTLLRDQRYGSPHPAMS